MSKDKHSERLEREHNRGQEDYADNKNYRPILDMLTELGSSKEDKEANKAYREGWTNAREQDPDNKSGCFLTTACCEAAGLPDDCDELTTLRSFRDNTLMTTDQGREMVEQYYREAPAIVSSIRSSGSFETIVSRLLVDIRAIVEHIKCGREQEAIHEYRRMFESLKG